MSLSGILLDGEMRRAGDRRIHGVVIGTVTNNQDEEKLGRIKVKFPWLSDEDESSWARIATPMAGKEQGIYFLPDVEDEVLVAFEQGDMRFPYVLGALWNGKAPPPLTNDDGKNNVRLIKSRSGHTIRLNDEQGKETIEINDKESKNSIVIDIAKNAITITSEKDITLAAPNGKISLNAKEIAIASSADTTINVQGNMEAIAKEETTIKGASINLN